MYKNTSLSLERKQLTQRMKMNAHMIGCEILNIYHYLHLGQRRFLNTFCLFGESGNVLYTEKYNSFKYKIIFLKIYIC